MKKLIKWGGLFFGTIILLIVISSIVIMFIVDKNFITTEMSQALNRHVTIGDINIGIFSVLSGIEVREVNISNHKTEKGLLALKGKPVKDEDLFVGLKAFSFKIKFFPILSGKFVLQELVLYEPTFNVIKGKDGSFNFDDLITPGTTPPIEKKEKGVEAKKSPTKKSPEKPFKVDDIPIEIAIGRIGIENGQLKFVDKGLKQSFQVYDLTVLVHSIKIDPKDLDNKDSVDIQLKMGIKTIGVVKSGSVKSFDLGFDITGNIIPFDKKTRIADPEAVLKVGIPYGMMSGLQIIEKMKSVDSLSKYCGKLNFLKKDITWKDGNVTIWYKAGIVKLSKGRIKTEDYVLSFLGKTNVFTKAVGLDINMLLANKHQKTIRSGIKGNIEKGLKGKMKKYVKADKVTDISMNRMINDDGKVYLMYRVSGTMNKPKTRLLHPKLPSLKELIKDASGDIKDVVKDKARVEAKKVIEKGKSILDDKTTKGKDKAAKKLKKKLKKKKFKF